VFYTPGDGDKTTKEGEKDREMRRKKQKCCTTKSAKLAAMMKKERERGGGENRRDRGRRKRIKYDERSSERAHAERIRRGECEEETR